MIYDSGEGVAPGVLWRLDGGFFVFGVWQRQGLTQGLAVRLCTLQLWTCRGDRTGWHLHNSAMDLFIIQG
jgi:hypothetical protein